MLKIIHVVHGLGNGGLERMVVSLANALSRRGYRQWICCVRERGNLADLVLPEIPIINLAARPRDYSLTGRLGRIFREVRPDVVHTHNWGSWPEATMAAAMMRRVRTVQTFHGFIEDMPLRRRLAAPLLARMTNVLTVVSASLVRDVADFCSVSPDRISVVRNGVDCGCFQAQPIGETVWQRPSGGSVVTWCAAIGSLTPAKHPENLLQAIRYLPSTIGLMWIGDGPLRGALERTAEQLGIADRVRWLGYQPDVKPWVGQADIVVSSSRSEALPLNLLEAMAMGRPVIATRVGGVPEIITDGVDGVTVPAEDSGALAAAIESLAADPETRARLRRNARQRVVREFSLESMVDQYELMYRRISGRRPVPHRETPFGSAVQGAGIRHPRTRNRTGATSASPRIDPKGSPRPRILVVGPFPPAIGGMVSVIQSIIRSPLSESFDFIPFALTSADGGTESLGRRVVRHLRNAMNLAATLRRRRIDVLYLHTCSGATFYRQMLDFAAARVLGVKTVWHIHGARFDEFLAGLGGLRRLAVRWAIQGADRVIVLGQYWKEVVERFAPFAVVAIVANAVDTFPEARDPSPQSPRCLFIGDLSERKGVDDLVDVVSTGRIGMRLGIIGEGPWQRKRQLADRIRAFGAQDRVRLMGAVPPRRIREELCKSSLFVLPSYAEGLPMAMLEAMAAGLPVVVTDVGAIPEVVRDGEEGFVIRPGDKTALVDRCHRLIANDGLRRRMGRNARIRVQSLFSLDRMVNALHPVFTDLARGGRQTPR